VGKQPLKSTFIQSAFFYQLIQGLPTHYSFEKIDKTVGILESFITSGEKCPTVFTFILMLGGLFPPFDDVQKATDITTFF